jgi:hypothetical protein
MEYIWLFIGSYVVAFILWFIYMSQKMGRMAKQLSSNGLSQDDIDEFYKRMGGASLITLVWSTFFSGSLLGCLVALIYWLIK